MLSEVGMHRNILIIGVTMVTSISTYIENILYQSKGRSREIG